MVYGNLSVICEIWSHVVGEYVLEKRVLAVAEVSFVHYVVVTCERTMWKSFTLLQNAEERIAFWRFFTLQQKFYISSSKPQRRFFEISSEYRTIVIFRKFLIHSVEGDTVIWHKRENIFNDDDETDLISISSMWCCMYTYTPLPPSNLNVIMK